jgi:hypothetical protein
MKGPWMTKKLLLSLFLCSMLSACGLVGGRSTNYGMQMPWGDRWRGRFSSNGEQIYMSATNEEGEIIGYSGGPGTSGMMMGAYLTCASCHGADGRGGVHTMHMQVMDAPDIRYSALASEAEEHNGGEEAHPPEEDDHAAAHAEYELADFRRAVIEGQHPDGKPLDRNMPRWEMSDQDLADLFEFIKSLQ